MEINSTNYENTCGPQPPGVFYSDPGNNPNFVFENDQSYEAIKLFDIDGNTVFVNSWVECVHYVKGGWLSNEVVNFQGDKYLSLGLFTVCCLITMAIFYRNRNEAT